MPFFAMSYLLNVAVFNLKLKCLLILFLIKVLGSYLKLEFWFVPIQKLSSCTALLD